MKLVRPKSRHHSSRAPGQQQQQIKHQNNQNQQVDQDISHIIVNTSAQDEVKDDLLNSVLTPGAPVNIQQAQTSRTITSRN